jgi:hypothetical protein
MVPTDVSYSMRTTASIIVNGTVCVTSDARLKTNIQPLSADRCKQFIMESNPVSFSYIEDTRKNTHLGLIAQKVASGKYPSLVNISPYPGLKMDYTDGFISPADTSLTVAYEEIIPIVMTATKSVMEENEELKARVAKLEQLVSILMDKLN